jgi:hypothetical protein
LGDRGCIQGTKNGTFWPHACDWTITLAAAAITATDANAHNFEIARVNSSILQLGGDLQPGAITLEDKDHSGMPSFPVCGADF